MAAGSGGSGAPEAVGFGDCPQHWQQVGSRPDEQEQLPAPSPAHIVERSAAVGGWQLLSGRRQRRGSGSCGGAGQVGFAGAPACCAHLAAVHMSNIHLNAPHLRVAAALVDCKWLQNRVSRPGAHSERSAIIWVELVAALRAAAGVCRRSGGEADC